jgi:predicted HD phosphohydrolase
VWGMAITDSDTRASFTNFAESTKEDWQKIIPQLAHAQVLVPDRCLNLLAALEQDHGGFPVNRLEHSLQTATRAEEDGKDEEYILCSLIHDIGDTLSPYNHPDIAATILKPFVSEANHWMVKHHGIFQGYYFWDFIGLDGNAREAYRDSEYFDYTAEFCAKYDGAAFDPDYVSAPLDHFAPLVQKLLSAPPGNRQ